MPDPSSRKLRTQRAARVPRYEDIEANYLESLTAEKSASLTELQNATTWGLTIITTGALFIVGRATFPDYLSLLGLLVLMVLATHFTTRTAKGYINVVRWSLIQRMLISGFLDEVPDIEGRRQVIRAYHLDWALPVRRRDVVWKSLVELGYGYIFVLLVGAVVYCLTELPLALHHYLALAVALGMILFDLVVFSRSPYMRRPVPHSDARRLR
ncbi:hypothetical protein [Micromonospora sp. NPDC049645]|uniref:hypothetical protein n=1 Tax=Micromonospora sp. NPDC049645 TaxID=3155508 RepID=UPI003441A7C7